MTVAGRDSLTLGGVGMTSASRYDDVITIRTVTSTVIKGRTSKSYTDRIVPAKINMIAGVERLANGVLTEPQERLIARCGYLSKPNDNVRIVYRGIQYRIVGIADIGRRIEVRVECRRED